MDDVNNIYIYNHLYVGYVFSCILVDGIQLTNFILKKNVV